VVIGRNEGTRLRRCLDSVLGQTPSVVYVDSGSTDGSVDLARSLGVEAVELDLSTPFTAARARNAGADRLAGREHPFLQFVDGDCGMHPSWLDRAGASLESHPDWGIVCGRLRERDREATIYNRLADMEWDGPVGEIKACGGIMAVRAEAFEAVGGFDAGVVAAEDDEFCLRVRRAGWKVVRIDVEMADHDMAMTRFGQWWRRAVRCGYAYADGWARHGRSPERHFARQLRGAAFWGLGLPLAAVAPAWPTSGLSLALLVAYPLLYHRIARGRRRRGDPTADARLYSLFCVLSKFAQVVGAARYALRRAGRRPARAIDHRGTAEPEPTPAGAATYDHTDGGPR